MSISFIIGQDKYSELSTKASMTFEVVMVSSDSRNTYVFSGNCSSVDEAENRYYERELEYCEKFPIEIEQWKQMILNKETEEPQILIVKHIFIKNGNLLEGNLEEVKEFVVVERRYSSWSVFMKSMKEKVKNEHE